MPEPAATSKVHFFVVTAHAPLVIPRRGDINKPKQFRCGGASVRHQARSSKAAARAGPSCPKSHDATDDECNANREREVTAHLRTEQD